MAIAEIIVEQALSHLLPIVLGMVVERIKGRKKDRIEFQSISDFWGASNEILAAGKYVSMQGALSKYAPMLIGPPRAKREIHRAYRRSIPEEDYKNSKTTVDAYLAFTAGQMVWRLDFAESPWVYLGLYHSIVRNSIPVFVEKDYYASTVEKIFTRAGNPHTVEAGITGRLQGIPGSIINEFVERNMLGNLIKPEIIEAGKRIFGIMVDGHETEIKYSGTARYLDGDIWVAVDLHGEQLFVSRFLDLADPGDVAEECEKLRQDVEAILPEGRVVFQFDQVDKPLTGYQAVSVDDLIKRITRRE